MIMMLVGMLAIFTLASLNWTDVKSWMETQRQKVIEERKINERHRVEGEVVKVNHSAPDIFPPYRGMAIYFKDGRRLQLWGVSPKPIEVGKWYKITYNGNDDFVNAEEIDRK